MFQAVSLVLLLASTWLVVGLALANASAGVVSAGRTFFAAIGLLGLLLWTRPPGTTRAALLTRLAGEYRPGQLIMLAGTGVAGYTVLSTVAIGLAGPVLPSLVLSISPAVVLLLEAALQRRAIPRGALLGTLAAIAGAVLYVVPKLGGTQGSQTGWGLVAAIGAMTSMIIYSLSFAVINEDHHGPMTPRILPIYAVGCLPLVGWAGIELARGEHLTSGTLAVLALLGIVIYVPAYVLQHRLLVDAGPAFTSLLGLAVAPIVGFGSALVGLAGFPSPTQIAGIGVTFVAMVVVIRLKFRTTAAPTSERATARSATGRRTTYP